MSSSNAAIFIERRCRALLHRGQDRTGFLCFVSLLTLVAGYAHASGGPHDAREYYKDFPLIIDVMWHIIVGVTLTAGYFLVGGGVYLMLTRKWEASPAEFAFMGYPLGLVMALVLSVVSVAHPVGRYVAGLLLVGAILPVLRWRPDRRTFRFMLRISFLVLPFAAFFGGFMGLQWHGPTETLSACPMPDIVYYAANSVSLASQPHPFRYLSIFGHNVAYFNVLVPFVAASLLWLPGFDPILFFVVSGTAGAVFSLGVCLALLGDLAREAGSWRQPEKGLMLTLTALVVGAARYPSWIAESVPVTQAMTILFCVYFMVREGSKGLVRPEAGFASALVGAALSKPGALAVLGPFAGLRFLQQATLMGGWKRNIILGLSVVTLLLVAHQVVVILPDYVSKVHMGPDLLRYISRTQVWKTTTIAAGVLLALREAGLVLIGLAISRHASFSIKVAVWSGIACWWMAAFSFHIAGVCAMLLVACTLLDNPQWFTRTPKIFLFSAILLVPAQLVDPAGPIAGAVWLLSVGGMVWVVLTEAGQYQENGNHESSFIARKATLGMTTLLLTCAIVIGSGIVPFGRVATCVPTNKITPEFRDIWRSVKNLTPRNALIFTDRDGNDALLSSCFSCYPAAAGRQIYVATLYGATNKQDAEVLDKLIRENSLVMEGRINPAELQNAGVYKTYYAVVATGRSVPPNFELVYRNKDYCLYSIRPPER